MIDAIRFANVAKMDAFMYFLYWQHYYLAGRLYGMTREEKEAFLRAKLAQVNRAAKLCPDIPDHESPALEDWITASQDNSPEAVLNVTKAIVLQLMKREVTRLLEGDNNTWKIYNTMPVPIRKVRAKAKQIIEEYERNHNNPYFILDKEEHVKALEGILIQERLSSALIGKKAATDKIKRQIGQLGKELANTDLHVHEYNRLHNENTTKAVFLKWILEEVNRPPLEPVTIPPELEKLLTEAPQTTAGIIEEAQKEAQRMFANWLSMFENSLIFHQHDRREYLLSLYNDAQQERKGKRNNGLFMHGRPERDNEARVNFSLDRYGTANTAKDLKMQLYRDAILKHLSGQIAAESERPPDNSGRPPGPKSGQNSFEEQFKSPGAMARALEIAEEAGMIREGRYQYGAKYPLSAFYYLLRKLDLLGGSFGGPQLDIIAQHFGTTLGKNTYSANFNALNLINGSALDHYQEYFKKYEAGR